ncbi:hypothetical protein [Pseudomonas sp.]|uniref:hypothetical protein n=1 Tax=Pseudomonas sp. TaxID=306 RepID=UPI00258880E6|nr:hypothetical protein [Pseudomonas sp.]
MGIEIEVAENGYIVEYKDPQIMEANSKDGAKWEDPHVQRVYATQAAMMEDLASILPALKPSEPSPASEEGMAFNEAFKSE